MRHRGVWIELRILSFRKRKPHERSFYAWNRLGKEYLLRARVDADGVVTFGQTVSRSKPTQLAVRLPPRLIVLAACSGAHEWARGFDADQAPRAHIVFQRLRRTSPTRSRSLQRLLGALSHSDKVWESNKRHSQCEEQNSVGNEVWEDY
jgi:hypothetical protein